MPAPMSLSNGFRFFTLLTILCLIFLCCASPSSSSPATSVSSSIHEPECASAAGIPTSDTVALNRALFALVSNSTFFSLFSVALDKPCPFWRDDNHMCVIRDCTVHSCEETEIPKAWRDSESCPPSSSSPSTTTTTSNDKKQHDAQVDRSLTGLAALVGPPPCVATDTTTWVARDDDDDSLYVDLRRNPERFTGYAGPDARRVWDAVYSENCFTFSQKCSSGICAPDTCIEERVLYRLISGLHASISMHIAREYLFSSSSSSLFSPFFTIINQLVSSLFNNNQTHRDGRWGRNVEIYKQRLRAYPERLANLRVIYAVVLRAVAKAAPKLRPAQDQFSYTTGNEANDDLTKRLLNELFEHRMLQPGCENDETVFDETDMFDRDHRHMLPEFRNAFRNISMIMDCVGCEKCRLWGKLQFLGLGTAMRILFEREMPNFERNDIIALFNLLYKLSTSVLLIDELEAQIEQRKVMTLKLIMTVGAVLLSILSVISSTSSARKKSKETSKSKDSLPNSSDTNSNCVSTTTTATASKESVRSLSDTTETKEKANEVSEVKSEGEDSTVSSDVRGTGTEMQSQTPKTPKTRRKSLAMEDSSSELTKSAPRRSERLRKRNLAKAD